MADVDASGGAGFFPRRPRCGFDTGWRSLDRLRHRSDIEQSSLEAIRDRDDSTLVYTADTGFTELLATFARKVDLLVIEASYPKNKTKEKHLELAEAMHIIRKAQPKRAVLTHLYPIWDKFDFAKEVAKYSPPCELIEAVDGLEIEFKN